MFKQEFVTEIPTSPTSEKFFNEAYNCAISKDFGMDLRTFSSKL
jgi:hypothetical protein